MCIMWRNIRTWTINNKVVVLFAIFVAVLSVAPQIFFIFGDAYDGIHMFGTDAEHFYLTRANEAHEGNYLVGDAFLDEKEQPFLYPILGENIMGVLGRISTLSIAEVDIVLKFVLPIVFFLLIYAFVYRVFRSQSIAILSALLILLGYNLLDGYSHVLGLFSFSSSALDFLPYTRPIHPSISSLFLFVSLFLLFKATRNDTTPSIKQSLGIGALIGVSLYSYIYVWTFLVVFLGLYGVYYIAKKDWSRFKSFIIIAGTNIVVTVPYWSNFFQARADVDYIATATRIGLVETHMPVFSIWLMLGLLAVLFVWPRMYKDSRNFFLISILSLWVVTNQHVITGIRLHFSHYHFYITKPFVAILAAMFGVFVIHAILKGDRWKKVAVVIVSAVLLYNGFLIQIGSYNRYEERFVEYQKYGVLMEHLSSTYEDSQNIWGDPLMSEFIPVYTYHNAPNADPAGYFLRDTEYFEDRILLRYKLRDIAPENILDVMKEERRDVSRLTYIMQYRENIGSYEDIPDTQLEHLADLYKETYATPFEELFDQMDVDIVVVDTNINEKGLAFLGEGVLVGESFVVYER